MRHKNQALPVAFLAIVTLVPFLSACAGTSGSSGVNQTDPFFTDRVATVRIAISENDWDSFRADAFSKQYIKADFWFDGELIPDVGLRTKGNASLGQTVGWDSPRLPLAIDFNLFNRARTFYGLKKVHFNNGWSDPTLLRDVISYEIFAGAGVPSPRASIVDVWVNDHHLGVYTMAEAVDTPLLERYYDNANGNLYKPEVIAARLNWTEDEACKSFSGYGMSSPPAQDPALYTNIGGGPLINLLRALGEEDSVAIYEDIAEPQGNIGRGLPPMTMPKNLLEAAGLKTNQNSPDYSGLFKLLDVINNEPDATFPQEIEKVLDVAEALKFFAVSACIVHLDNYIGIGHNTYFYESNGKFSIIPWDLNMTFGTFNSGIRKDGIINYYIDEPTAGPMNRFPLVARLLSYPPYLETYRGYMQDLLDGPFSLDVVLPRLDQLVEMVRPYAKADTEMFYSYEDWERCITEDLRPPDIFEGWMAGGPSPALPWAISQTESNKLYQLFGARSLWEIVARDLKPGDIEALKACLSPENYDLFLQNYYGPLKAPQPPRQPGFGPNSLGLKTAIIARYESVRQQLDGERPSGSGTGAGNGGSMWMVDWMGG